jgi:hypothetical protein
MFERQERYGRICQRPLLNQCRYFQRGVSDSPVSKVNRRTSPTMKRRDGLSRDPFPEPNPLDLGEMSNEPK